VPDEKNDPI
jgi:hypothetical protein